jgi:hypothetical protein
MNITRKSQYSGKTRTKDLPITEDQLIAYANGVLLQEAFHNLSSSDREFIKTGIVDEEWREMSGEKDDV